MNTYLIYMYIKNDNLLPEIYICIYVYSLSKKDH